MLPNNIPLGWPPNLSKGSRLDYFLWWKWEKSLNCFEGCQHIISSMHGWRRVVCLIMCLAWCDLEAYRRGVTVTNYIWWKWEKTAKVSMEGQGHIFTFALIFSGSTCDTEGSCVQWIVFFLFLQYWGTKE